MPTLDEQCHEWADDAWTVWFADEPFVIGAGYCMRCGGKLLADGSEQAQVAAVTPEAVRATWFFSYLSDVGQTHIDEDRWYDLVGLGLAQDGPPDITDQGRVILAALSQAHGLAAAEWLAEYIAEYGESLCPTCPKKEFCPDDGAGCADRLLRAALQQAEADGPSAEEMLDALDDEYRRKCDWEDGLDENVTRWRETPRQHARALIAQKEAGDAN